jgi:hypothetical protein
MADTEKLDSPWLGGLLLGIALGSVVTLVGAGLERAAVFGLRLTRIGQLLFVLAFLSGGVYCAKRDQDLRAAGLIVIAVGWALLFADAVLVALFADAFVLAILGVLVVGCVVVVLGLMQDGFASETGAQSDAPSSSEGSAAEE